jgi:CheY-like chemotaxis protein
MSKKILLADDSITIQKVIELTFSDEDFEVVTVGNGRLALERLPEVRPDIVLCDIIMPEKDGYEVCEQVKSNPAWSHVPVLLLTGAFEPFDQERASRAGYDGSLAKPFEPETLIAKVKELLARAPSRPTSPPVAVFAPPVPTVVPFARPTSAGQSSATAPQASPLAARPTPKAPLTGGFISDEPFPDDERPEPRPEPAAQAPPAAPLAPLSDEETATLAGASPVAQEEPDAASTVMFRPTELPWTPGEPSPPTATSEPPPRPAPTPPPAPRVVPTAPVSEPSPLLVPEKAPPPAVEPMLEEPPVFEAVLDEDLDFGTEGYEPAAIHEPTGGETLFAPEPLAPTATPTASTEPAAIEAPGAPMAASIDELVPEAAPGATSRATEPEPTFVEELPSPLDADVPVEERGPLDEPAPLATLEPPYPGVPEPAPIPDPQPMPRPMPMPAPQPVPEPEPRPAPAPEPAPEPIPAPQPDPEPAPRPAPRPPSSPTPEAASAPAPHLADFDSTLAPGVEPTGGGPLADLDLPAQEPEEPAATTPASQAAALSVPVDMVETIAQRVVSQVSEKVVREIAWEVIPDLAEALIKREIERLKAELQKT